MSPKPSVPAEVQAAVRAWAAEEELEDGAQVLALERRKLPSELHATLRSEVAEISVECLIEVLALERGVEPGETVEVFGLALLPKQVERLSAWILDQRAVADALGVDPEAWGRMLVSGLDRYRAAQGAGDGAQDTAAADKLLRAKSLLGDHSLPFQNRPQPGASGQAGVAGLLGAMRFRRKKPR